MFNGFLKGITAYAQAFRLISTLGLWGYLIVPAFISLLIGGLIGTSAWSLSDDIGNFLVSFYPWGTGKQAVEQVATILGGVLVAGSGLLLYKHLVLILSASFMGPLSEKVENHLLGIKQQAVRFSVSQMISDTSRGLKIALRNITRELFYTILLSLLGLIPFFSPFAAILIIAVQSFYTGFGNMDYTLGRHLNFRDSVRFVRTHRGLALGNGVIFIGLLAIGIGFLIAPPLSTIAATIETTKRLDVQKPVSDLV